MSDIQLEFTADDRGAAEKAIRAAQAVQQAGEAGAKALDQQAAAAERLADAMERAKRASDPAPVQAMQRDHAQFRAWQDANPGLTHQEQPRRKPMEEPMVRRDDGWLDIDEIPAEADQLAITAKPKDPSAADRALADIVARQRAEAAGRRMAERDAEDAAANPALTRDPEDAPKRKPMQEHGVNIGEDGRREKADDFDLSDVVPTTDADPLAKGKELQRKEAEAEAAKAAAAAAALPALTRDPKEAVQRKPMQEAGTVIGEDGRREAADDFSLADFTPPDEGPLAKGKDLLRKEADAEAERRAFADLAARQRADEASRRMAEREAERVARIKSADEARRDLERAKGVVQQMDARDDRDFDPAPLTLEPQNAVEMSRSRLKELEAKQKELDEARRDLERAKGGVVQLEIPRDRAPRETPSGGTGAPDYGEAELPVEDRYALEVSDAKLSDLAAQRRAREDQDAEAAKDDRTPLARGLEPRRTTPMDVPREKGPRETPDTLAPDFDPAPAPDQGAGSLANRKGQSPFEAAMAFEESRRQDHAEFDLTNDRLEADAKLAKESDGLGNRFVALAASAGGAAIALRAAAQIAADFAAVRNKDREDAGTKGARLRKTGMALADLGLDEDTFAAIADTTGSRATVADQESAIQRLAEIQKAKQLGTPGFTKGEVMNALNAVKATGDLSLIDAYANPMAMGGTADLVLKQELAKRARRPDLLNGSVEDAVRTVAARQGVITQAEGIFDAAASGTKEREEWGQYQRGMNDRVSQAQREAEKKAGGWTAVGARLRDRFEEAGLVAPPVQDFARANEIDRAGPDLINAATALSAAAAKLETLAPGLRLPSPNAKNAER